MKKLWLDLGNTRLKYWLTEAKAETGKAAEAETKVETVLTHGAEQHLQAPADMLLGLTDRFTQYQPDFIGVSSVLGGKLNEKITATLSQLNVPFELVTVHNKHPIMHSHYDPTQLGVDRWLQMLGVATDFKKVCVVGCGTAITIDLISNQTHAGGYIFPSIYLQRESLQSGTRQISIPEQHFKKISVGENTADAVHRGILLSIVGAINEILRRHDDHMLVMTGGDASVIAQHLEKPAHIHADLLLKGMQAYFAGN